MSMYKLTWETNIWTIIECCAEKENIDWYFADHNDTMIILDDIRWSSSMINAWKEITSSIDYHVSIDLFRMGIILPRKQQIKQHFVLKLQS